MANKIMDQITENLIKEVKNNADYYNINDAINSINSYNESVKKHTVQNPLGSKFCNMTDIKNKHQGYGIETNRETIFAKNYEYLYNWKENNIIGDSNDIYTPNVGIPYWLTNTFYTDPVREIMQKNKIFDIVTQFQLGKFENESISFTQISYNADDAPFTPWGTEGGSDINISFSNIGTMKRQIMLRVNEYYENQLNLINNLSQYQEQQTAAMNKIMQTINKVGFYGFQIEQNKVFGLLNDPSLRPFIVAPNSIANPSKNHYKYKTYTESREDFMLMLSEICINSGNNISLDYLKVNKFIVVCTSSYELYLAKLMNNFQNTSLLAQLKNEYPLMEIITTNDFVNTTDEYIQIIIPEYNNKPTILYIYQSLYKGYSPEIKTGGFIQKVAYSVSGIKVLKPLLISTLKFTNN